MLRGCLEGVSAMSGKYREGVRFGFDWTRWAVVHPGKPQLAQVGPKLSWLTLVSPG